jgi:hypothetical protein
VTDPTEPMKFKDREARIRAKAHDLWEKEGRPAGQAEDHWRRAAQAVDREIEGLGAAAPGQDVEGTPSADTGAPAAEVGTPTETPANARVSRQR